ncbi:peptide ABC transporter ATP-binding protein [Halarcobacter ebronensis]|uniref:Peptide ABC transporter ATP-binding protein n=1 Tax=Halarcobacter ebronensis TaxID=1462615 RepID=A0A4Q0YJQ3_9BACT|nr:ATP-binding cassette domain-containing protein [Halarcobacter ebronensis]RXJ69201.1 peptide ABC transporter ATP-binding protein [Halarcobacter ebronensis]
MLKIENVYKIYNKNSIALKNINFNVKRGDTVGIIGESGSGKSSLGKLILGLDRVTKGKILIENKDSSSWHKNNLGEVSFVFQNYKESLNPFFTIEESIQEIFWKEKKRTKSELESFLKMINLEKIILSRFPHELSGGELQRIAILRALLTDPTLLVLDEALNALDISNQILITNLLKKKKEKKAMTTILISHDLEIATMFCDKLIILKEGELIEILNSDFLKDAKHSYTKTLLDAVIPLNLD